MSDSTPQKTVSLSEAFIGSMMALGFKESSVEQILNDRFFKAVLTDHPVKQRANLIVIIQRLFLTQDEQPPAFVSGALSIAYDPTAWMNDMYNIVLPFLKENEETYFG